MIRRTLVATLATLVLLGALAVAPVSAARPVWVFSTTLTGEAERPNPGDPDAVGHATILIWPDTDTVCWAVSWARVDTGEGFVTASHIHGPATTEEAAGVLVPLFVGASFAGQGSNQGCIVDSDADAIAANPSMYYVNVHSSVFPPGAVRGQLD
jgi:hypothetical protein